MALKGYVALKPAGTRRLTGKPTVTITERYIRFNKDCVDMLDYPKDVEILINESDNTFAIRPTRADKRNAIAFAKPQSHSASIRNNHGLLDKIIEKFDLTPDNEDMTPYAKIIGTYDEDNKAIIFKFDEAKTNEMKKRGRKLGDTGTKRADKKIEETVEEAAVMEEPAANSADTTETVDEFIEEALND